ncbi:MAG TPA: hypothetical protein PKA10_06255 [Selenomonadales bacterium]|nr:hypothetical protein [Selenomonadales bacterium]
MARKNQVQDLSILGKAWSEIKKINWHEVNRLCQQSFHIGLAGSEQEVARMKTWLFTFPYLIPGAPVPDKLRYPVRDVSQYISIISSETEVTDEKLIKSTTFCLASPRLVNEVRRYKGEVYVFGNDTYNLTTQLLSNHRELQFALAHNFPVFRPELAQAVIQDTAFQNAAWALLSGLPGALPGPYTLIATPLEGISDFTVLTLNEIKLLFELVGLSGYRVTPLYHVVEFGIIVGLAKLAESVVTTALSRFPGRTGILIKGAAAYAFTWTIGEMLFFYLSTGHRLSRKVFIDRFHRHYGRGKRVVCEIQGAKA